jgi:UDP-GlcNAc3NAcA epimerase
MRILSIVGARPQFIKVATICREVKRRTGVEHKIVHTGQHYDANMSAVFFGELGIPEPDFNLEVGSGSHGEQTGEMIKRLEPILVREPPDWVLLFGDTNSTLAGAVAATKLGLPTAHVEAGLRSFNRSMPEELNRVAADHLSDLLLAPTQAAMDNLANEGLAARSRNTGDVMYDASLAFRQLAESRGGTLAERWKPGEFALATIHRAENTDDPARLGRLLAALKRVGEEHCPVLLPLHPRTLARMTAQGWEPERLHLCDPVSYLDMLLLEGRARFILTDSGGVQKEAYFAKVPCITLREETEWVETLDGQCNVLTGAREDDIVRAANSAREAGPWRDYYGNGDAAARVLDALESRR